MGDLNYALGRMHAAFVSIITMNWAGDITSYCFPRCIRGCTQCPGSLLGNWLAVSMRFFL